MGLMRFLVPERRSLAADAVERAYFTGLDEIPWRSRTQWTDDGLVVRRSEADSGNFHIPWIVPGHGQMSLSTGCLREKDSPYHLTVELARGTVNRIRNQLATWQSAGVNFGDRLPLLSKALDLLAQAATAQHEPLRAERLAEQSLVASFDCMAQLCRAYSENSLTIRRKQPGRTPSVLGVNLGGAPLTETAARYVVNTFNSCVVPFSWSEIEVAEGKYDWTLSDRQVDWAKANGIKVLGGPLLQLDRAGLPPWIYLYEGDIGSLSSFVEGHVRSVVNRYRGRVNLWQCAARLNVNDSLDLGEEQRLRLAALAIETVRAADPRTPLTITIDQPWAEFMRSQDCDFSPLHFADALVRADLGVGGIGLEINVGYAHDSTQPRDMLDFIRQIDRWSSLGLPLMITLTAPSSSTPDAKAGSKIPTIAAASSLPLLQAQSRLIEQLVPVLLAKPAVQGIIWNQLLDAVPHDLPHAGLFDATGGLKPAAVALRDARQRFLT